MLGGFNLSKASRNGTLVVLAGAVGFALGLGAVLAYGPMSLAELLCDAPVAIQSVLLATPLSFGAAAAAGLFANLRRRVRVRLLRNALNYMTQGLCMFDRTGRLILCNERYAELYHLRPEQARPGVHLRDLLAYRAATGTFVGDPESYVVNLLRQAADGRTESKTIELPDGRIMAVVSRPMPGGGWVATHFDVTERLRVEQERDTLLRREERRRQTDRAIASFRARVESGLRTVSDSTGAMKVAAKSLLTRSDHTLRRAEAAVHGSNEASSNV